MKQRLDEKTETLSAIFALLALLVSGFLFAGCVKRPTGATNIAAVPESASLQPPPNKAERISINIATEQELEKLPGIGKGLAERIIEHREKYGAFRRVEHLIIVRGISDKRFRALRELVTVE